MEQHGSAWKAFRIQRGWTQEQAATALGVSASLVRAIEQGRHEPGQRAAQAMASIMGVRAPGGGGGGRGGRNPRELSPAEYESMLSACWALFYAGKTEDAVASVQAGVRSLGAQGGDVLPLLGRFQQLAGVLARDDKRLTDAITHGAAAVEIARLGQSPDYLAGALFRLARTYQQAGQTEAAVRAAQEAHGLAPRCQQPLSGWLKLCRVEIESKVGPNEARLPMVEQRRLLDQARAELSNRPGADDSYTALTMGGILHIEVLALSRDAQSLGDAQDLIRQAMERLEPGQHRWRYGMMATEAMIYALQNDAEMAADLAEEALQVTRANSHLNYLRRGLAALEAGDPDGRNPQVVRLRRLIQSA